MSEKMSVETFGKELLRTNDLDPLYVLLHEARLPPEQLQRWLLAYWCSYHAGFSCWVSESSDSDFWRQMELFANNETASPIKGRWPRGQERRHFRGDKARQAIAYLSKKYSRPESAVQYLQAPLQAYPLRFGILRGRVMNWPQFGPWIAFKIGDMLDRVLGIPIDFTQSDIFVFDSPREAAEIFANDKTSRAVPKALAHLNETIGYHSAPPSYDRRVNIQEFETVLCKWKSYLNDSYHVGKDIHEILAGLAEWAPVSETALKLSNQRDALTLHTN